MSVIERTAPGAEEAPAPQPAMPALFTGQVIPQRVAVSLGQLENGTRVVVVQLGFAGCSLEVVLDGETGEAIGEQIVTQSKRVASGLVAATPQDAAEMAKATKGLVGAPRRR